MHKLKEQEYNMYVHLDQSVLVRVFELITTNWGFRQYLVGLRDLQIVIGMKRRLIWMIRLWHI